MGLTGPAKGLSRGGSDSRVRLAYCGRAAASLLAVLFALLLGVEAAWAQNVATLVDGTGQVRQPNASHLVARADREAAFTPAVDAGSPAGLRFRSAVSRGQGCAGSAAVGGATSGGLVNDCEALLASEAALVGAGTALDWDVGTAIAGWKGVTLVSGRVDRLLLVGHGLAGTIPAELGGLSGLTRLRLRSNALAGSIPSELGDLSSLTVLDIRDNALTGSIPEELADLSRLTLLGLHTNALTGCIPVALRSFAGTINPQRNGANLAVCLGVPVLTLTPGDAEIDASWTVPAGGAPTGYDLEYKRSGAGSWTDAGHSGTGTTATIGSLVNGSRYDVRVRAKTATDRGAWSATASATPRQPNTAPRFGTVTAADQSYAVGVAIPTLTLPAATGGNGELVYTLKPDPPAGLAFDGAARTLSGTPRAGQSATAYTYRVTDSDDDTSATDADFLRFTIAVIDGCAGSPAVAGATSGGLVDDCEALLASEAALVGAGAALNWDTGTPMAGWDGVSLASGRVDRLRLMDHGLAGTVPAELGDLSGLTRLRLQGNSLGGSIPRELGDLSSLTVLDLRHNALTGTIPRELTHLSRLTGLWLTGNALTGSIPKELGDLPRLGQLHLADNALTGSIPKELGKLSRLAGLELGGNLLTGTIPEELGNLSNLTLLGLHTNALSGCIPAALLRFAGTINPQRNGARLPACPGVPVLTLTAGDAEIDASWTVPAGGSPTGYDLEYRRSGAGSWTDAGHSGTGTTATIGSLVNGSRYDVRVRAKTATDTGAWSAAASATPRQPNTAPTFGVAAAADQSYAVGVAIPTLTLPAATGGNGELVYTLRPDPPAGLTFDAAARTLSGTPTSGQSATPYTYRVTDSDDDTSATDEDFLRFTIAVIDGCAGSPAVAGATSGGLVDDCEALLASEAALVGAGSALNWDAGTPMAGWDGVSLASGRVDRLRLMDHGLAGTVPAELADLSGLTRLRLQDNSLGGSIPRELGDLSSLTVLDARHNALTGSIPEELAKLSRLTGLWLTGNALTGTIPVALGDLPRLGELRLAENALTGCIPAALLRFAGTINPQRNGVNLPLCPGVPVLTLTAGDAEIDASWTVPAGGSPTGYDLEYKRSVDTTWTDAGHAGTGTTATIGSLVNGSTYDVRVRAKTATDTGAWSATASATPRASNTAPTFGAAGASAADQTYAVGVEIETLTLPAATGGNGDLVYALSPDPPPGLVFDGAARTLSGTPTAGQSATPYTYRVTDSDDDTSATDADSLRFTIAVTRSQSCAGSAAVGGATSGGLVDDCKALLASEAALVGAGTALNWDAGTAMAGWDGVSLASGRVDRLRLMDHGLAGTVPAELADLTGLTRLRLQDNSLGGSIPRELGDLSSLTVLDARHNALTGSIPEELANLSRLTGLWLTDNALTGTIPVALGDLPRLGELRLADNALTGCIPAALLRFAGTINPQRNGVNLPLCPGVPVLTLTAGDAEIDASWTVPAGGVPTGYDLEYKRSVDDDWTDSGHSGTGTTATIGSLANGSTYDVRVRAKTATDTGAWSATASATPETGGSTRSTAPTFGTATVANQSYALNTAIANLTLPAATGGDGALVYTLSPAPPLGLTFNAAARTLTGTPTAGQSATTYTYKVADSDADTTSSDADALRFTIAVSFGCSGSTAVGAVTSGGLVDDCEALLASEAALVGTGTALNWDVGTAMADWDGVGLASGRVDRVLLVGHGLAGTIPAKLGGLSALTRLRLRSNSLGVRSRRSWATCPASLRSISETTR